MSRSRGGHLPQAFVGSFQKRGKKTHAKFTNEEDERLSHLVACHGEDDWYAISAEMPGRNERQCRDRWLNYLSPAVSRSNWTLQEDNILRERYATHPRKWTVIAQQLPGRTNGQTKNRWLQLNRQVRRCSDSPAVVRTPRSKAKTPGSPPLPPRMDQQPMSTPQKDEIPYDMFSGERDSDPGEFSWELLM